MDINHWMARRWMRVARLDTDQLQELHTAEDRAGHRWRDAGIAVLHKFEAATGSFWSQSIPVEMRETLMTQWLESRHGAWGHALMRLINSNNLMPGESGYYSEMDCVHDVDHACVADENFPPHRAGQIVGRKAPKLLQQQSFIQTGGQ